MERGELLNSGDDGTNNENAEEGKMNDHEGEGEK